MSEEGDALCFNPVFVKPSCKQIVSTRYYSSFVTQSSPVMSSPAGTHFTARTSMHELICDLSSFPWLCAAPLVETDESTDA